MAIRIKVVTIVFACSFLSLLFLPALASGEGNTCHYCKKGFVGQEVIAVDNKVFHKSCFKCGHCGKRIRDEVRKDKTKYYHRKCYEKYISLWCGICDDEILSDWYKDYWGNYYHAYHKDVKPECMYCGRFLSHKVSKGGFMYNDGRPICGICKEAAIFDIDQATKLMSEVRDSLAVFNLKIDIDQIDLRLVDKTGMGKHSGGIDASGYCRYRIERSRTDSIKIKYCTIYILDGMPQFCFIKTLAHELMHVWIGHNSPSDQDQMLSEGSCNYAAYLIVRQFKDNVAKYEIAGMMQSNDLAYGVGLQIVKRLVDKNDIDYWLQYLKENRHLPQPSKETGGN